ncbi:MAG TPA: hypothetical protein DDY98_07945 [Ruminococcaceae bacterium]|nr:hypothetical protein [Oscillospiraceae bacterium]
MKRLWLCFTVLLVFAFGFSALAAEKSTDYEEQMESSGAVHLMDALSEESKELLETLGIDSVDFDSLFHVSPKQVLSLFFEVIRNEYHSPFKTALSAASVLLMLAVAQSFLDGETPLSKSVMHIGCVVLALVVVVPMAECLVRLVSAVTAQSNLMLALIPVLAVVITVSGNPTLALSYNTLTFAMAQGTVQLVQGTVQPLIQMMLSLGIVSSFSDSLGLEKAIAFIKKSGIFLMSLVSTVFVTMLVLKGTLASSADTVAVRGIRFIIGRAIPVVGSAVSDAYLSLIGSMNLVKNTAAVFAIVCILLIALPVLTEGLLWSVTVNLLASFSELFGLSKPAELLRNLSGGLTLLNVTLLLASVVAVLSVGLILVIKSSAGG